ncbi:hypothetical protein ACQPYE_08060 [Actinosynnema sp. CA-299493]
MVATTSFHGRWSRGVAQAVSGGVLGRCGRSWPLTPEDINVDGDVSLVGLLKSCWATLDACRFVSVRVAAAVRAFDGEVFSAVQVRSTTCSHCSVCAEPVVLGMALTAGVERIDACVAIRRLHEGFEILSPCGSCRELLRDTGVLRVVVASRPTGLVVLSPDELLPWS